MKLARRASVSFTGPSAPTDLEVDLEPLDPELLAEQACELIEAAHLVALETGSAADVVFIGRTASSQPD